MNSYALSEIHQLLSQIDEERPDRSSLVRYLCAMFAELAYYHVPQFEMDNAKRVKVIPCEAHQRFAAAGGGGASVEEALSQADVGKNYFAVATRGVVATGVYVRDFLFVGFRGTQFLFDWRTNLRARMVRPQHWRWRHFPESGAGFGGFHSGFLEETMRVMPAVNDAIQSLEIRELRRIYLCGHSLGGAVAAIAEDFIRNGPTSVCVFGAPRYCNLEALCRPREIAPAQVRRHGDVVPTVPPRWFGYADYLTEFLTDGRMFLQGRPSVPVFDGLLTWLSFIGRRFEPHSVEAYRRELGQVRAVSQFDGLIFTLGDGLSATMTAA